MCHKHKKRENVCCQPKETKYISCNDYIILRVGIQVLNKLFIKLALTIEGQIHIIAKQYYP
jgi:hypothetical protein